MIEAAIFDVGGVLINSPRTAVSDDVKQELELDDHAIEAIWKDLIPLIGSGKIDEAQFWRRISEQYGSRDIAVDENLLGRAFIETLRNNDELLSYIKELGKKGIKLAVLSNTIEAHAKPLREAGLFEPFDYVFLSHEVGMRKPHPAIYEHVIDAMGVEPKETLFIDDDRENVQAAEKLGIHGIVATTPLQVIEDIKPFVQ